MRKLNLIASTFCLGTALLMYITFLGAYFNPDKTILIDINFFGESQIEIFLITVLLIVSVVNYLLLWKDEYNVSRKRKGLPFSE